MDTRALRLLRLVRSSLRRVEETTDLEKDGTAVQGLKSFVVRMIAERELRASEHDAGGDSRDAAAAVNRQEEEEEAA